MSDGTGFAIDMLGWQLHRQFMQQQDGIARDNVQLQLHNQQLVNRYNNLVRDFRALQKQAGDRIGQLERELATAKRETAAKEHARELAQAEADSLRWSLEMVRNPEG